MNLKELILQELTLQEENKSVYREINLVRYGGLSPTPHDIHYKMRKDYFHTPPSKAGIFCFIKGYEEPSLYFWKSKGDPEKFKKESFLKKREFSYKGKIWTHYKIDDPKIVYYREKGSWYETDTNYLNYIFSKLAKKDEPKKFEVYIDRTNLGGI